VEADESYRRVLSLPAGAGEVEIQRAPRAQAQKERADLAPRIPRLQVVLEGATASEVEVRVDGVFINASALAAPMHMNPGNRLVIGRRGAEQANVVVKLVEGQLASARLQFGLAERGRAAATLLPRTAPNVVRRPPEAALPPPHLLSEPEVPAQDSGAGAAAADAGNAQDSGVTLTSAARMAFIVSDTWIGASDLASEGQFIWADGSALQFENWAAAQPDNFGGTEDCVEKRLLNGGWVDAPCSTLKGVLCESSE
jgi:hypothetical protein